MADRIFDLTATAVVATGDVIPIVDISDTAQSGDGSTRKVTLDNLMFGRSNIWTGTQRFSGLVGFGQVATASQQVSITAADGATTPFTITTGASPTVNALRVLDSAATLRARILVDDDDTLIEVGAFDNGAGYGSYFTARRNNNATTPAAGHLRLEANDGTIYRLWPDATGVFRIHTANPTNALDTAGTVVGAQTSILAAKNVLGENLTPPDALATMLRTKVVDFVYKNGRFDNERFRGVVTDWSPEFGMDDNRVLNPINALGYTIQAIKALNDKIQQLETQLSALQV